MRCSFITCIFFTTFEAKQVSHIFAETDGNVAVRTDGIQPNFYFIKTGQKPHV